MKVSNLTQFFSDGLVQPPTRNSLQPDLFGDGPWVGLKNNPKKQLRPANLLRGVGWVIVNYPF